MISVANLVACTCLFLQSPAAFTCSALGRWQMLGGVMLCITGAEAMYAGEGCSVLCTYSLHVIVFAIFDIGGCRLADSMRLHDCWEACPDALCFFAALCRPGTLQQKGSGGEFCAI